MTYSVTWSVAAVTLLHRIIAAANDPVRIRKAADWVDYTLRRIPMNVGESRRTLNEREWYEDVLGVLFRVNVDAMTVRIISIGPARRR
jgi:hypothetical protein